MVLGSQTISLRLNSLEQESVLTHDWKDSASLFNQTYELFVGKLCVVQITLPAPFSSHTYRRKIKSWCISLLNLINNGDQNKVF